MSATTPRGRIVWYENLAHDPKKAVDFYTRLIGWGTEVMPGPQPYTMFTLKGAPLAGTLEMPAEPKKAGTPSHWIMYVGTPDVDATVKQARGLGARVYVEPRDIPKMGRFAVLADPQGAIFAVWTSSQPGGGETTPPEPGMFSWHELATTDHAKAFDFYQKLFGWEKRNAHDMGPMGTYQLWSLPGTPWPIGAMFNRPKEMPVSAWILYISVPDINAAVAKVKQLGGQVMMGPMEVPGGDWVAQGTDTNGAVFALHQVKR